jgi:hypothetical protein
LCVGKVRLTASDVRRIRKLLQTDFRHPKPMLGHHLPAYFDFGLRPAFTSSGLRDDVADFFEWKPPSFTFAFCRCARSQLVPPLADDAVCAIAPVLTPGKTKSMHCNKYRCNYLRQETTKEGCL